MCMGGGGFVRSYVHTCVRGCHSFILFRWSTHPQITYLHNILKFIPYPLILYRNHKSYTVDIAEKENCKVTPEEIKEQLDVITVQVD